MKRMNFTLMNAIVWRPLIVLEAATDCEIKTILKQQLPASLCHNIRPRLRPCIAKV